MLKKYFDIPGDISTPITINIDQSIRSLIDYPKDVDWFRVYLEEGHEYKITLQGLSSFSGTLRDPYIKGIYDQNGERIPSTSNDDGGIGLDSKLIFTPSYSGTYYISAGAFLNATGSYTLTVQDLGPTEPDQDSTSSEVTPQSPGDWTIMLYMNGDNNLEKYALSDLNEMESVNLPDDVHITFLLDRSPYYSTNDGDWADTKRGLVSHDEDRSHISSPMESLGELDLGDPETLTSFINWSVEIAPAQHYALVIWDHGGGVDGVSWDFSSDDDNLTLNELDSAIEGAELTHFDIIGFDACLMGVINTIYELSDNANYLITSEETIPAPGWDYDGWLSIFSSSDDNISAYELAVAAADSYDESYRYPVTLSVIDTSFIEELNTAMQSLSCNLQSENAYTSLINAAMESKHFSDKNYVDLYNLMENFLNEDISPSMAENIGEIMNAINDLVVYNAGGMADSNGISLYFPLKSDNYYTEDTSLWLSESGWMEVYNHIWETELV